MSDRNCQPGADDTYKHRSHVHRRSLSRSAGGGRRRRRRPRSRRLRHHRRRHRSRRCSGPVVFVAHRAFFPRRFTLFLSPARPCPFLLTPTSFCPPLLPPLSALPAHPAPPVALARSTSTRTRDRGRVVLWSRTRHPATAAAIFSYERGAIADRDRFPPR